jgi:hypothetical protein
VPLTDTSVTPAGWALVSYGDAQISVPRDWQVTSRLVCGRTVPGYLVLGDASTTLRVRNARCRQSANVAAILPHQIDRGQSWSPTRVINGIPVVRVSTAQVPRGLVSYLAPTLHALVTARGPLASRVLATLTRSPLSVVLAAGPLSSVPGGWRWHVFGGIRFAAPASWQLTRSTTWGSCFGAFSMDPGTVTLSAAVRVLALSCPAMPDLVRLWPLPQAVIVGAGRVARLDASQYDGCRILHHLRACYSASIHNDGLLDVAVFVPGRHRPTIVEIGLAGSGATARTIFDSIEPG